MMNLSRNKTLLTYLHLKLEKKSFKERIHYVELLSFLALKNQPDKKVLEIFLSWNELERSRDYETIILVLSRGYVLGARTIARFLILLIKNYGNLDDLLPYLKRCPRDALGVTILDHTDGNITVLEVALTLKRYNFLRALLLRMSPMYMLEYRDLVAVLRNPEIMKKVIICEDEEIRDIFHEYYVKML